MGHASYGLASLEALIKGRTVLDAPPAFLSGTFLKTIRLFSPSAHVEHFIATGPGAVDGNWCSTHEALPAHARGGCSPLLSLWLASRRSCHSFTMARRDAMFNSRERRFNDLSAEPFQLVKVPITYLCLEGWRQRNLNACISCPPYTSQK